ncbi:hypothetical protein ABK040_008375 [Willaertia magna]
MEFFTQEKYLCLYGGNHSINYLNSNQPIGSLFDRFVNLLRVNQVNNNNTNNNYNTNNNNSIDELFEMHYKTSLEYNNFYLNSFNFLYYQNEDWFYSFLQTNKGIIILLENENEEMKKCLDIIKIIKKHCNLKITVLILFCNVNLQQWDVIEDWNNFVKTVDDNFTKREYHIENVNLEKEKSRIYEILEWFFSVCKGK